MIKKVISTIERYQMLKKGATVIVALSGGADSMALLKIFTSLSSEYNINLIAAHVNHGLRGNESKSDELFVTEYCSKLGIDLRVLNTDVREIASKSGEGIEECGRRIRYEFFDSIYPNSLIATAHTLSDCMETTLFNLARGSTLKGLCGIPPVRENIIRPLIECSRIEIENFCCEYGIQYVTDSTNMLDEYMRNHIRHNIVPQLKIINAAFDEAYYRCLKSISEDEVFLTQLSLELLSRAETYNGYSIEILLDSNIAVRKRAVASLIFKQTQEHAENKHVQAVDELLSRGGSIQIHKDVMVRAKDGILYFPAKKAEISPWSKELSEGLVALPDAAAQIEIVYKKDLDNIQNIHNNILDFCFDYDKIIGIASIRNRCEGDRIRLRNTNCTKSLKKLFNEKSVPPEDRSKVAIICDSEGLLWVEGFGCAERCKISEETNRICMIQFRRAQNA